MYRKLHLQLTAFCALVISAILVSMTCITLKLIWENQEMKHFNDFQKTVNNLYQTLADQNSVSHTWLRKISEEYGLQISILDNNVPLLYHSRTETENWDVRVSQARHTAETAYALTQLSVKNSSAPKHIEFREVMDGEHFLVSVSYIPKEFGILTVTVLAASASVSGMNQLYLNIIYTALCAIVLLCIFSYFLIRHLIRPLKKNHQQQIDFFAAASHELRSPLAVIIASLSAMENTSEDKAEDFFHIVEKESRRMQRLVNDMFTLSSLDTGAMAIHLQYADLDNLLIEVYEKFQALAFRKNIRIHFHLPNDLLPRAFCDPERISQVYTILLDNALSYTPENGNIHLSLLLQSGSFVTVFSDSGIGISEEDKKKIFSRFYRCDNSRTDKNHFGLGLSIAMEIMELHGGTIFVEDSPEGGAEFKVLLPVSA